MSSEDRWWTADDASRYLQVSSDTIYRWIEKKKMPAKRIGKKWLFKKDEIDAWIESAGKKGKDNA